mgnify:CR=1 FL=1
MNIKEIEDNNTSLIHQLLEIWEDSVRATHLFLSDEEIENIKKYVPQALKEVSHLLIIENFLRRFHATIIQPLFYHPIKATFKKCGSFFCPIPLDE